MPEHRPSLRLPLAGSAAAIVLVFALGPRERFSERWVEPELPADLDGWLSEQEGAVSALRDGDGKEIVWADATARAPTRVSLVYLHGFSADRHEIEPVLSEVAAEVGANLFFTRLAGHGRDGAAMAEATVEAWLDDTAEAVAIGERIGERVIVVGTSTGGTLATWAAARRETQGRLAGVVLISPNFRPKNRDARIFLVPWGAQIARLIVGPERCFTPENDAQARHWTTCYPVTVLRTMMALVERVRTMDLSGIRVPTLVLYSPGDQVVDPEVTREVVSGMTGTVPTLHEVRTTSDPSRHVLAGDIVSPESAHEVRALLRTFIEAVEAEGGGATP